MLLYGLTQSEAIVPLLTWRESTPGLHAFVPDFHRLQMEHWVWSRRLDLGRDILDIGVANPRRWLGDGYVTLGPDDEDIRGNLLALPFGDESFDGVVLTEVLEHCTDPARALREVYRVLRPGGLLLVTSPFVWPDHHTEDYPDYWRFTEQGWRLLLQAFADVTVSACQWTPEAAAAYDVMRRFECLGFASMTTATTGYLCEARKGQSA